MSFEKTHIPDLVVYTPKVHGDNRGYFMESFNTKQFINSGISEPFIQDNQAGSSYGVLRGLHYQLNPFAQAKLVRVLKGKVLDVAVDIRKGSPTYLESFSIELSEENNKQLYVPRGFAHGYVVLSETAVFFYKVDNTYSKESEGGIIYNDSTLNIDWKIPEEDMIISEKDKILPGVDNMNHNFEYQGQ